VAPHWPARFVHTRVLGVAAAAACIGASLHALRPDLATSQAGLIGHAAVRVVVVTACWAGLMFVGRRVGRSSNEVSDPLSTGELAR
jgi:hypothetical protein